MSIFFPYQLHTFDHKPKHVKNKLAMAKRPVMHGWMSLADERAAEGTADKNKKKDSPSIVVHKWTKMKKQKQ